MTYSNYYSKKEEKVKLASIRKTVLLGIHQDCFRYITFRRYYGMKVHAVSIFYFLLIGTPIYKNDTLPAHSIRTAAFDPLLQDADLKILVTPPNVRLFVPALHSVMCLSVELHVPA